MVDNMSLQMRYFDLGQTQGYCVWITGAVAQLARAPAWHAGGRGFKSHQLHWIYYRTSREPIGSRGRSSDRSL